MKAFMEKQCKSSCQKHPRNIQKSSYQKYPRNTQKSSYQKHPRALVMKQKFSSKLSFTFLQVERNGVLQ